MTHAKPEEVRVDDVTLYARSAGSGEPLILVHGAWTEHNSWQPVAPPLSALFQVVVYDRRGHSRSQRTHGPRSTHEDDLAGLIETLDLAPAHLAGYSYGGSIALGVAARRPELVHSVIAHEPPLFSVGERNPELRQAMGEALAQLQEVADLLRTGNTRHGAAKFIEEVALDPGMWDELPEGIRQTMICNAPAFLEMMSDPQWADLDVEALSRAARPILLTDGGQSQPHFSALMAELTRMVSGVQRHTFPGAGHMPHLSQPVEYVEIVRSFVAAIPSPER